MHQAKADHNGALRSLSRAGKGGGIGRKETRCYRKTKRARAPLSAIARRKKTAGRGTRHPSQNKRMRSFWREPPPLERKREKGAGGSKAVERKTRSGRKGKSNANLAQRRSAFASGTTKRGGIPSAHPRERARRAQKRVPFRLPKPAGAESALTPDKSASAFEKSGAGLGKPLRSKSPCARAYRRSFERSAPRARNKWLSSVRRARNGIPKFTREYAGECITRKARQHIYGNPARHNEAHKQAQCAPRKWGTRAVLYLILD